MGAGLLILVGEKTTARNFKHEISALRSFHVDKGRNNKTQEVFLQVGWGFKIATAKELYFYNALRAVDAKKC